MAKPPPSAPFPRHRPHLPLVRTGRADARRPSALTQAEGFPLLRLPDEELLDVLVAAYRVRHCCFGNRVI